MKSIGRGIQPLEGFLEGFVLAGTFMALGILVILAGSVGEMFGFTKAASNLTTVAGVVVEAISGLGLYLFNDSASGSCIARSLLPTTPRAVCLGCG